jgi:hypothetical protein
LALAANVSRFSCLLWRFFFVPFGVNFSDFVPMSLVFTVSLNIKIAFLHVGINAQAHSSRAG